MTRSPVALVLDLAEGRHMKTRQVEWSSAPPDQRPIVILVGPSHGLVEAGAPSFLANADDFVIAGDNMAAELAVRIETALQRRRHQLPPCPQMEWGGVRLDLARQCADLNGKSVELTSQQWRLLVSLVSARGVAVPHWELCHFAHVQMHAENANLRVAIDGLRRRLGRGGPTIRAKRGSGYFIVPRKSQK